MISWQLVYKWRWLFFFICLCYSVSYILCSRTELECTHKATAIKRTWRCSLCIVIKSRCSPSFMPPHSPSLLAHSVRFCPLLPSEAPLCFTTSPLCRCFQLVSLPSCPICLARPVCLVWGASSLLRPLPASLSQPFCLWLFPLKKMESVLLDL